MGLKIRKDDTVRIIAGKDKGRTGRVLRVDPGKDKVYVEGANIIKRHTRPRTLRDTQRAQELGGIVEKEGPIHVSNVMLIDPDSGEPTRVGDQARGRPARARGQEVGQGDRLMEAVGPGQHPAAAQGALRAGDRARAPAALRYSSAMEVPRIEKITLNMGVGEAKQDSNMLDAATEQLATIAGQRPNVRRASKSIAAFKLRDGMPVGVSVTLRRARMWEFLDRLMSIAIPRIRDFRGLNPRSFDGRGNYSMGVREQIIFPEIDYDAIDQVRGLDVTITTSAQTDEEAYALLRELGMPFSPRGRAGRGHRGGGGGRRGAAPRGGAREGGGRAGRLRGAQGREPGGLREARARERRKRASESAKRHRSRWQRLHRRSASSADPSTRRRNYNRCKRCGRPRAYLRKFGLCRICLREIAHEGMIPGLTKSQLVTDADRPDSRLPDPHPQRPARRPRRRGDARLDLQGGAGAHPQRAGLHRGLRGRAGRVGRVLRVTLKYTEDRKPVISGIERLSKPGRRHYVSAGEVPKVHGGMGTAIISTSRGVMTGHDARRAGVGGELVARVW